MKRIIQLQESLDNKPPEKLVHAWFSSVFPHPEQWRNEYGSTFVYSSGNIQILCISDPEMVKELSLCTSLNLGKPRSLSTDRGPLLGRGILSPNGLYWAHQRKIIAPEFYLDRVKGWVSLITESTLTMVKTWENKIESSGGKAEVNINEELRSLSADIISRTCFGRRYALGEKIFTKLQLLQRLMSRGNIGIPGLRHLPTKLNKEIWKLEKEINSMILNVVKSRSSDDDDDNKQKDLIRLLLSASESYRDGSNIPTDITPNKFIVDNCKNLYFAGHETTAVSATWCLMMLAAYPDWQARARTEVLGVCGTNVPTLDMLRNMKVLSMVIQETLRLYPPIAYIVREALEDISMRGLNIPQGINVHIPVPLLLQDQKLWGLDAHEFKPERFANGVAGACKIPHAYMPFGLGPRTCAGQHFAMAELKVMLTLVLSKIRWSLSPAYHHSPAPRLMLQRQHVLPAIIQKL